MTKINICRVPEHFNFPWQLCLENNSFNKKNFDVHWTNVPEGTGKMCQMLRNKTTDIAIILTEGIIKDICFGNDAKIIQIYVESPLQWGIHVDAKSNYFSINDLENTKAAISRLGSGSHLMSFVHANQMKWNIKKLNFEIVNTIDGAVKALSENRADYFMWEKLMTKPLVDSGIFRHIADCPTPWPSFVVAVRGDFLENNKKEIIEILETINLQTKKLKTMEGIAEKIATKFNLEVNDVKQWLQKTEWSQKQLSEKMLNNVQNQLLKLKLIDKKVTFAAVIATL